MAIEVWANDGSATVSSGGTDAPSAGSVETWTLTGSTFPAVSSSATPPTVCYGCDALAASESEKFEFTDITGSGPWTATVTRGADGTTPVTHIGGFTIRTVLTRASLEALQLPPSADTGVRFLRDDDTWVPAVSPPTFAVTATQQGVAYDGMSMTLRVLTGAAATQPGAVAGNNTVAEPQEQAITPSATGSIVYGAAIALNDGTFVPTAATDYFQDTEVSYSAGQFRNVGYTTSGTAITLGNSGTNLGVGITMIEALASGTLTEDPSTPVPTAWDSVTAMTTAAFQPPPSALLVLMISAVGSLHSFSGVTSVAVTDDSGLGLNWTETAGENADGSGYVGVWIAQVPSGFASSAAVIDDQTPALEASLSAGGPLAGPSGDIGLFWLLASLANRNGAPCPIPVIGDSITEGMGATEFATRYVTVASRESRAQWPTIVNGNVGGLGFIPFEGTGETTFTWPVSLNSGDGIIGNETFGPVRSAVGMFSAASTFTFAAPAGTTSVTIMYYNSGDGAQFSYQVGSGPVTTVTASGTAADGALTSSIPMTGGQSLSVTWVSGSIWLDGIIHYAGDESSGVTWHGCGHFGWDTGTDSTGWNQTQAQGVDWRASIAALSPSAIAINLGTNDSGVGIAPAQTASNVETLITYLQGNATLSTLPVLLFIPVFTVDAGSQAYAIALRGLVASVPNLWPIDVNYRMLSEPYAPSLYYDGGVHPNDPGHALYGAIAAAGVRIA